MVLLPAPFLSTGLLQREDRAAPAGQPSLPHQSGALSTPWPRFVVPGRQRQVRHGCQTPRHRQPWSILLPWRRFEQAQSMSSCVPAWALLHPFAPHTTSPISHKHSNATDPPACEWNPRSSRVWGWNGGGRQQHAVSSITAQSWGTEQRLKGFSEHSSFDWTNSASKPGLTQPHKTASVPPLRMQFTAGQSPDAISPALAAGAHSATDSTALSHHAQPRQTGDIPSYKPAGETHADNELIHIRFRMASISPQDPWKWRVYSHLLSQATRPQYWQHLTRCFRVPQSQI